MSVFLTKFVDCDQKLKLGSNNNKKSVAHLVFEHREKSLADPRLYKLILNMLIFLLLQNCFELNHYINL